jgi:hypothetical protein
MSAISSTGNIINQNYEYTKNEISKSYFIDGNDTTPPFTNCTIDPAEPDGDNGWYVSNLIVELTAMDDLSGVKEIRISICGDPEIVFPGNYIKFSFNEDYEDYYIDYWAIDNAGNVENKKRFSFKMDITRPELSFSYEIYYLYWFFRELRYMFTAIAEDSTSGMDRVEFYLNEEHQETVEGPGKRYWCIWKPTNYEKMIGFILMPEITDGFVKFYSLFVKVNYGPFLDDFYAYAYDKAGNVNSDKISDIVSPPHVNDYKLFQNITIPNNYSGHLGRFFINIKINQDG